MKTPYKSILYLFSIMLILVSCSQQSKDTTADEATIDDKSTENAMDSKIDKAEKLFFMLPSPLETASLLKKAGATYNIAILNSADNVSKYESISIKAINLGIYGADLSYTSIFDQAKEQMLYIKCAKKLADDLGITNAFNKETMERMEKNMNKKDSMLNIISESYWVTDSYLKENQRANISALIIAGGWIEGLYIATKLVDNTSPNQEIVKRIGEQVYSLKQLIDLLKSYEQDSNLESILNNLQSLKQIYDKLEIVHQQGEATVDPKSGITTIGGTTEIKIPKELLTEIITKVGEIRNSYIQ